MHTTAWCGDDEQVNAPDATCQQDRRQASTPQGRIRLVPRFFDELLNQQEPAWPQVKAWLDGAKGRNDEVLDASPARAKDVLLALQVTTRSPMGAIAFQRVACSSTRVGCGSSAAAARASKETSRPTRSAGSASPTAIPRCWGSCCRATRTASLRTFAGRIGTPFHFHPPRFTEPEPGIPRSRKDVPMDELLALSLEFMEQLNEPRPEAPAR